MMVFFVRPRGILVWMKQTMRYHQTRRFLKRAVIIYLKINNNSKGNILSNNKIIKVLKICSSKVFSIMIFYKLIQ